jgi:hypothetical protein
MIQFDSDQLNEANRDYLDRIKRVGLFAIYDSVLDTLFLEIGEPTEAINEHVADNIYVRVSPKTLQIVAIEIIDFLNDFLPANRLFREVMSYWNPQDCPDTRVALTDPEMASIREVAENLFSSVSPQPSRAE